ncbi:hypothetical protein OFN93_03840 [Campylobacter sp. CN_NE4]|uniref:hypothetical protein n=1 Tax=unclassified Campylobacter TaxID=2593542 RepID=UPI0022E99C79|nr:MULTISPECIES: hypothetical protein [unclassified Campylobacter]MDA3065408.1 hypothetical protein [Campylobacter sp. CN_NE4]MDA3069290.1 hypothetical protein [Campylobacter sp. CN_NE3]MDA3084559.1 hypothetical protein [Campylobacter sp. CN_NE1]WBR52918.1 hypothetical protein PF028_00685 [Campylobacter sp. CN_NE2]
MSGQLKAYKEQMEIDYFAYFAKAYFAFNCYLKDKFSNCKADRDKIDKMKNANSSIFTRLLKEDLFIQNLIELKNKLSNRFIINDNEPVCFEHVKIKSFQDNEICKNQKHYTKTYYIKILSNGRVIVRIDNNEIIDCPYNEFENKLNNSSLTDTQKNRVRSYITNEINSYVKDITPLITKLSNKETLTDDEKKDIYRAFIEIIYSMRNALFHSEIDPENTETKQAYENAYWLLREFVKKLS